MPPEIILPAERVLTAFLAAVGRRLRVVDFLRAGRSAAIAAAIGLALAPLIGYRSPAVWIAVAPVAVAAAAITMWRARVRWSGNAVAALVERGIPESHNVVFTAREMLTSPGAFAPWMQRRVVDAAAGVVGRASAPSLVPMSRDAVWLGIASAVAVALAFVGPSPAWRAVRSSLAALPRPGAPTVAAGMRLTATVTPPSYTGLPVRTVTEPESLEVIQGSRIGLTVAGSKGWSIRFGARVLPASAAGDLRTELVPEESGYFAIERNGGDGDRRLVPVTVTADRAPSVRIEAPGKDLLLPAGRGAIALTVAAGDDFGLESVDLRYTKVSGSGEQFDFVEGSLPLSIARESAKAWKGAGAFDLARLGLEPGDSLVYRAVARDRRPGGAGVAASDTFFIEVAGPGQVALPGFELPPDRERYALSQQMIVLKLQRLRARESTLSREALIQEIDTIAAEQRAVRANFIFLMGGHVEDEEEEAAQSNEIQEGRLENSARREINTAIRFMSQAEKALAAADTGAALPPAKSAVDALQRAFGHNRYFLRTLAVRSRLDPARRLTGELKDASDWRRALEPAALDAKTREARRLLARLLDLLPAGGLPPAESASVVGQLAEEALAIDPGSQDWQRTSSALVKLRDALGPGRGPDEVRRAVSAALTPLVVVAKRGAVRAGDNRGPTDALQSAWAAEARRR